MKRLIGLILFSSLLFSSALSVGASPDIYPTAWELYTSWNGELPDYVSGVWVSDDGSASLTFGIVEGATGDAGKSTILDSIEDDNTVRFCTHKYSAVELEAAVDYINTYTTKNVGIMETYLDYKRNRVEVLVLADKVNDRSTQSIVDTIRKKYGAMISINYKGDMFKQTILAVGDGDNGGSDKLGAIRYLIIIISAVIALLASGYLIILRKRGNLISESRMLKQKTDKSLEIAEKPTDKSDEKLSIDLDNETSHDCDENSSDADIASSDSNASSDSDDK